MLALAATLSVAACGGGETTQSAPPASAVTPASVLTEARSGGEDGVVGGVPAQDDDARWASIAGMVRRGAEGPTSLHCGGSVVAPRWVLTAAHCVRGRLASSYDVVVGRRRLGGTDGQRIAVDRMVIHKGYETSPLLGNDIAMLHLAEDAEVPVVALAPPGAPNPAGEAAWFAGWGGLKEQQGEDPPPLPDVLMVASVPVQSDILCAAIPTYASYYNREQMLCAGVIEGGRDTCQGDSGGPLLVRGQGGEWLLYGLTSFGEGCARPNEYGYYTRVSSYRQWIDQAQRDTTPSDAPVAV